MSNANIYQKIVNIMERVQSVYKGAEVGYGKNSYKAVSHDDVTRLLHNEFVAEKIIMVPSVVKSLSKEITMKGKNGEYQAFCSEVDVDVAIINAEAPDERIMLLSSGFSFDTQDKSIGKAISYAVKYALLKLFMLESSDDEEQRIELENIKNPPKPIVKATEKQVEILLKQIKEDGAEPSEQTVAWASNLTDTEITKIIKDMEAKTGVVFS